MAAQRGSLQGVAKELLIKRGLQRSTRVLYVEGLKKWGVKLGLGRTSDPLYEDPVFGSTSHSRALGLKDDREEGLGFRV